MNFPTGKTYYFFFSVRYVFVWHSVERKALMEGSQSQRRMMLAVVTVALDSKCTTYDAKPHLPCISVHCSKYCIYKIIRLHDKSVQKYYKSLPQYSSTHFDSLPQNHSIALGYAHVLNHRYAEVHICLA